MLTVAVGQRVRASVVFTSDPTTVKFKVRTPANATTTYQYGVDAQVVKDSAANYHVDVDTTMAGDWWIHFEGTGNMAAVVEDEFQASLSHTP